VILPYSGSLTIAVLASCLGWWVYIAPDLRVSYTPNLNLSTCYNNKTPRDNMASEQCDEASSFGFLSLPAEICNKIYELVFVHEEAIYVATSRLRQGLSVLHRRIGDGNDRLIMPGKPCRVDLGACLTVYRQEDTQDVLPPPEYEQEFEPMLGVEKEEWTPPAAKPTAKKRRTSPSNANPSTIPATKRPARYIDIDSMDSPRLRAFASRQGARVRQSISEIIKKAKSGNTMAMDLIHILHYAVTEGAATHDNLRVAWDAEKPWMAISDIVSLSEGTRIAATMLDIIIKHMLDGVPQLASVALLDASQVHAIISRSDSSPPRNWRGLEGISSHSTDHIVLPLFDGKDHYRAAHIAKSGTVTLYNSLAHYHNKEFSQQLKHNPDKPPHDYEQHRVALNAAIHLWIKTVPATARRQQRLRPLYRLVCHNTINRQSGFWKHARHAARKLPATVMNQRYSSRGAHELRSSTYHVRHGCVPVRRVRGKGLVSFSTKHPRFS
jgi:hypothetical protein